MTHQRTILLATLTTCLLLAQTALSADTPRRSDYGLPDTGSVKIVRDKFGTPHIIAGDDRSMFFGAGYAQAEDQLENLCKNYLRAQGRGAEQDGFAEVIFDQLVRSLELPRRAKQATDQLDDETRQHLQSFCDGVNTYVKENKDKVPTWVETVEPVHVAAFALYVDTMFSVGHCRDDLERAGIKIAGLDPQRMGMNPAEFGSNQFAISPKRSATGAALLSMDPHLQHRSFFRWYEMHMVSPSLNVMGPCFFGLPYVSMGRTEKTAWCMTVNGPDLGDVFVFDVNPDDPNLYRGVDGWTKFEDHEELHRMKSAKGLSERKLTWKSTALGPAIKIQDGKAYVFALPWHEGSNRIRELFEMSKAQSLPEFKKALAPLGIVMFNIVYADTAGDIYYVSNMRVPKRDQRIDSRELRPGDQVWARWQGYHPLEELPQVTNPPCGFLMNCNSGVGSVTLDVAPKAEDFPAYMLGQADNSRSRRMRELLSSAGPMTLEEARVIATDTHLEAAEQWVPNITSSLNELAAQYPDHTEILREVAKVLDDWDQRTDLNSRGAILFAYLMRDKEFVEAAQAVDYDKAEAALVKQAKEVRSKFGSLDAPWSEFSRIRRGDQESGVAGCGILEYAPHKSIVGAALRPTYGEFKDGKRFCNGGSSYGMLIDFAGPTRAISCLPYGESEHKDSPHFADQLPLYVETQFKPAWFWPDEIRENTESQVVKRTTE